MSTNATKILTGNATLVRPRFSPGLLLRDDDLTQGVDYARDLSRLLFRSLFGCGVVCGLKVAPSFQCGKLVVAVDAGVALNCCGDPIQIPDGQTLTVDPNCGEGLPPKLWVVIRHTAKCCAPRQTVCSCDDEDASSTCTRERDGFEIRLVATPPDGVCACTERELPPPPHQGTDTGQVPPDGAVRGTDMEPAFDCQCADPTADCYKDHYNGVCGCGCTASEWVVLAVLNGTSDDTSKWSVNHSVRRFVGPVLMRDPVVWAEQNPKSSNGTSS